MTTYKIHQIRLTDAEYDQINREGHDSVPANVVRMKLMFGNGFVKDDFKVFTPVTVMEADDLDEVFAIGNHMGDMSKVLLNMAPAHSISVGDLIENKETGEFHIVASCGFEVVEVK